MDSIASDYTKPQPTSPPLGGLTGFGGKTKLCEPSEPPIEVTFEIIEEVQTPAMRREALRIYAKAMLRAYLADQEERTNELRLGIL